MSFSKEFHCYDPLPEEIEEHIAKNPTLTYNQARQILREIAKNS
ncbi:MAG: hypothetical protein RLY43_2160 [Bacteroidota bacterium]|jgi:hypothetical protein